MTHPRAASVRFAIVVPAYDAAPWIGRCLRSLRRQRHRDLRVAVIDDASTDDTYARAARALRGDPRFTLTRRTERRGGLANVVAGFADLGGSEDDVLSVVDGDDWLDSPDALGTVARHYEDGDVWLTYGSYWRWKGRWKERLGWRKRRGICEPIPAEVLAARAFRRHPWVTAHLKTFRRFLWQAVRDEDLRGADGAHYATAWDVAMMFPMLEMAAPDHVRYVDEMIYVYNLVNPLGEGRNRRAEQLAVEAELRGKPVYPPLRRATAPPAG